MGAPIYNMTECLFFILNELDQKGFQAKYCHPLLIYITWPVVNKHLKLEYKKKEEREKPDNNTNFRPINDYKPSGKFLYNKDNKKTLFF